MGSLSMKEVLTIDRLRQALRLLRLTQLQLPNFYLEPNIWTFFAYSFAVLLVEYEVYSDRSAPPKLPIKS